MSIYVNSFNSFNINLIVLHHFQHVHLRWSAPEPSVARNLPALLELLCGLGQGPAAEYVSELLQAPKGGANGTPKLGDYES